MRQTAMALFPAFEESGSSKVEDSSKELDWLTNKSFQTNDALSLHRRFLEKKESSVDREVNSLKEDEEEEDIVPSKKKKNKSEKKKKKKKKHKRKSERRSDSSGSDSDTIFPSDLKKEEEEKRSQSAPVASRFSWLDDVQSPSEHLFCVDHKPDPANWTYKSLYRGDVARQGVSWEESESNKKHKDKKKAEDRYFSKVSRQMLSSSYFLPLGDDVGQNNGEQTGDRMQSSWVNPLGVYDSSTAQWLQGKGQEEPTEQQRQGSHTEQRAAHMARKTEEFNRQLRERPADTELWIKFIRHQDEVSSAEFGGEDAQQDNDTAERRKSSYRAVLEKKLSIVERAVETNPTCIALQLERLRICQELWEPSALAKEWKKLVFLHPNSAPLWREYLLFTQSYFSNFTVSKVNAAYGKCLSTLSAVRDGSMVSHPALPGTEEDMLDIFTQQCHFLRQSGHSEKAVSLFQAMIDFTFYKPDSVQKLSTKQQVDFFEPFWDSGEARLGSWGPEAGKPGCSNRSVADDDEEDEEEEEEEEVKDRSQPRGTVWLDVESSREAAHWLPWRPDKAKGQSEEDCEDPDRQVLFDDIGPSLICLSSPELQLGLLLHFLSFLGLPVDPVLSAAPCQPGLLLENLSLLIQGDQEVGGTGKQGERFVTNVLTMVQPVLPPHHRAILSLSWMQYEKLKVLHCLCSGNKKHLRSQSKSSKRVTKRLLKEPDNRSSLVLWREYAHLEWMLGNPDEARKVFSTATMIGGAKGLSSPSLCELCLLWSQLEVEDGADTSGGGLTDVTASPAVMVLTRLAEGTLSSSQSISPVSVLKARKAYEQAEQLRLSGLVGCYALFQYLTVGIQAANGVYSQAREKMEELHHTLDKQLNSKEEANLAITAAKNPAADSKQTSRLYVENRYHSAGRARRFFHSVTRDNSSVVPRLFAIVAEQQRKQLVDAAQRSCCHDTALPILPENGLSNRIRGLFESATSTEMDVRGKVDKARGIFYKALQNIPWAKGLYMDAVQLFPEHLQEYVDLMTEKELRLRLPLEELDILLED
ncbi:hypothetical protein INR49_011414 [Caranx melampygus]|nr:hypothetical protein INR49_011414 [Caranx melampygus]